MCCDCTLGRGNEDLVNKYVYTMQYNTMRTVHLRILEYSIDVDLQFDSLRDKHSVYQQLQAYYLDETKVHELHIFCFVLKLTDS